VLYRSTEKMEKQILEVINTLYTVQCESSDSTYQAKTEKFIKDLGEELPELSKKYSAIFAIFKNNRMTPKDMDRMKFMLTKAAEVRNGGISEHDASVAVGQVLVDDIVKPQLAANK